MKPVGKPDAGNPHVRFDERGWETGRRFPSALASILDSTQASAAAADTGMPTALRSVGLLDVVSTTSPGPSVARLVSTPVSTASRRTLVRNAGKRREIPIETPGGLLH